MAIAGIPMPLGPWESFQKGFGFDNDLMRQLLERRQLKQKADQYKEDLALRKAHLELQRAAGGRAAQAAADAHRAALNNLDPTFQARQYEALENYFKNRGAPSGGMPSGGMGMGGNLGQSMPQEAPGQEMGEGMGMYSPAGLEAAQQQQPSFMPSIEQQQPPTQPTNIGGPDLELMRSHPMLRGWYKKHFGIDPLAGQSGVLHGPARDASDLEKLKKEAGEDSEVYQNAKAQYQAGIDAKKDLRDLRARTKAGLKVGEKEFFDPQTGEPLGKEIPYTAKERESEEGNILFNELYPIVYKGASPFSGEGSIRRLEQAAANYKTDPKARKLFDDFLLADKMLAATTVNEASTLKSGHTNQTYNRLKESLEAQDVPKMIKKIIKEYQIPASAQLRAAMRYQKALSDARKKATKSTPATHRLFYNPELQSNYEAQKDQAAAIESQGTKVINGVTYYPDGQGGWEHD